MNVKFNRRMKINFLEAISRFRYSLFPFRRRQSRRRNGKELKHAAQSGLGICVCHKKTS